jgi:hypothetical protein
LTGQRTSWVAEVVLEVVLEGAEDNSSTVILLCPITYTIEARFK